MATFRESIEEMLKLKRRLAIWECIHQMVDDKFISKDGRKVSGLRIPNTEDLVPEEEIEDVLENIVNGPIMDLKKEIEQLENTPVVLLPDNKVKA